MCIRMPLAMQLYRTKNNNNKKCKTKNSNNVQNSRCAFQTSLSCKADKLLNLCDNAKHVSSCMSSLRHFNVDSNNSNL